MTKMFQPAHNAARLSVGVPPLIWSDRLAAVAQEWANTLLARNQLVHNGILCHFVTFAQARRALPKTCSKSKAGS
jgi:uncharacterized protein YkwD